MPGGFRQNPSGLQRAFERGTFSGTLSLRYRAPNQSIFPSYFCNPVYFLYGQLCTFCMVRSTFYTVNFLVFIWPTRVFIWSTFYFLKRRLQTGGKVQTEGKMQTEDYRPGVKGRFGSWRINRLWPRYRPDREAQERIVECLEASDIKHHSKITLTFAAQNKGMRNRYLFSK